MCNSEKTIYLVANSHIDPVWLWDKYEGIDEVLNTFRSACDRLDEYPLLKFTMSSICFLQWTRQYNSALFDRIKAFVRSGRWEIVGGWWIEPDCNLPSSVSFDKSAAISREFLDAHFGRLDVPVAYCPDSFGHPASLPSILTRQGFRFYLFCRPGADEKTDLPANLFYWEHEGNRVLCYRPIYHYTQGRQFDREKIQEILSDDDFVKGGLACCLFGVGNHGGGPSKVEIDYWLDQLEKVRSRRLIFSTCREFFEAAEQLANIPVYRGDLHYHAVGCYSVNRPIKQAVRQAEYALCYTQRVLQIAGSNHVDLQPLWE